MRFRLYYLYISLKERVDFRGFSTEATLLYAFLQYICILYLCSMFSLICLDSTSLLGTFAIGLNMNGGYFLM